MSWIKFKRFKPCAKPLPKKTLRVKTLSGPFSRFTTANIKYMGLPIQYKSNTNSYKSYNMPYLLM